jgi:hypothetical protein
MEHRRPIDILLVEDNADHAALTMRALRDGNMLNEIFWVKDGQEAVDFLDRAGRYAAPAQPPRPGLISSRPSSRSSSTGSWSITSLIRPSRGRR